MNSLNRAAWWCPSCSTYHAPHCDSCSRKGDANANKPVQPMRVPTTGDPIDPPSFTTCRQMQALVAA